MFPKFLGIDHVAIAIPEGELDAYVERYRVMGMAEEHREEVGGTDRVRESLLDSGLQLLEPMSEDSPVAKQITKNNGRPTIAHIAFRVADIHAAFEHLKANGFEIIDAAPRRGGSGSTVFFVHPRSVGFLMEVVQHGHAA